MNTTSADHYAAQVFWSDDDEGYIALAPDLPGCSAFSKSADGALAELRHAIEAWLKAATAAGNEIPSPSSAPEPQSFSGKFALRMPKELHASLTHQAETQGVSLNQFIVYLLAKNSAREELELPSIALAHTRQAIADSFYGFHALSSANLLAEFDTWRHPLNSLLICERLPNSSSESRELPKVSGHSVWSSRSILGHSDQPKNNPILVSWPVLPDSH